MENMIILLIYSVDFIHFIHSGFLGNLYILRFLNWTEIYADGNLQIILQISLNRGF